MVRVRRGKVMGGGARVLLLMLSCLASANCELAAIVAEDEEDEGKPDGARCREDEECRSGFCTSEELCAHSTCDCPGNTCGATGKATEPCAEHWVCMDADSIFDGVEEFFGGHPRKDKGYCQPLCQPECPEHYYCKGTYCAPQLGWADPVPSVVWSGAASGTKEGNGMTAEVQLERAKSVRLEGSASSPTDAAITSVSWKRVSSRGEEELVQGPVLDVVLGVDDSFARAELTVTDERSRTAFLTVIFAACIGAGETCGYEGSGCCNSCDRTLNVCQ